MLEIPLFKRGQVVAWTQVDDKDFPWLIQWRWGSSSPVGGHARRSIGRSDGRPGSTPIYMHREIMGLPRDAKKLGDFREVDHVDGDPLNNQRTNLRITSHRLNLQNRRPNNGSSSRYRGVAWYKAYGKWQAKAELDGKYYFVGYFDDEEQAANAISAWRLTNMSHTNEQRREAA